MRVVATFIRSRYCGRVVLVMHESHGLLTGKTVLVTAAAGTGIGFATAKRCIEEGARVAISDGHERRLGEAAEALAEVAARTGVVQTGLSALVAEQGWGGSDAGGAGAGGAGAEWKPVAVPCDVTSEADVQRMIDVTVEELGHIDVLVNNAGLGGDTQLADMTDEQWFRVLDVTLNGTFRCTRAALRHMLPRGSGVIVNNSSVIGWRAQAGQAHYAAAKAGVMALTRCAAIEAAPQGVRVNAVAPSIAMHEHLAKVSSDELLAALAAREAFGRAAEPWEVADVIVFLASDYSSYMTGEVVSVSSQRA
jgi:3-oxoacyl-[acyl-carrier protein] reductase